MNGLVKNLEPTRTLHSLGNDNKSETGFTDQRHVKRTL